MLFVRAFLPLPLSFKAPKNEPLISVCAFNSDHLGVSCSELPWTTSGVWDWEKEIRLYKPLQQNTDFLKLSGAFENMI